MKSALKLILYPVIVVSLIIFFAQLFKTHPEVQLSFLLPGIFIFLYSKIRDEVYVSLPVRLRMARGR
ncbi:hypothetical protein [Mucilaginibacter sp.]